MSGATGLLGREILKIDKDIDGLDRSMLDVTSDSSIGRVIDFLKPDCILHLAANTDTSASDIATNILGTGELALACKHYNIRLVYTSTDYVYWGRGPHHEDEAVNPTYNFAWSKLGGECAVRQVPNHLILRLSFGPRPFPHDKVYADQLNSKLYVDEIAPMVIKATKSSATGVMNIGGAPRTLEEYARETVPNIETIPRPEHVPFDTSMVIKRFQKL